MVLKTCKVREGRGLIWGSPKLLMDMQARVGGKEGKAALMCPGGCTGWQRQSRQAEALTSFQDVQ